MKRNVSMRLTALIMAMLIWLMAAGDVIAVGSGGISKTTRNFANVVIFAYFQDESNKDYYNETSNSNQSMTAAENIIEFYDGNYGRSVTNYLDTISDGQFAIKNIFPQWDEKDKTVTALELPFQKSAAETGNIDYNIVQYVSENCSLPEGITVDYDNDGLIDNLTVILQGGVSYDYTSTMPSLYPHQNSYPGDSSIDGKKVSSYNMLNTDRMLDSSQADQSGVICHEFLHTLGYPDLYTKDGSLPVNNWDIMGQSSRYLTRPLAYLRMSFTGWGDLPTLTESQKDVSLQVNEAVILVSPLNPYELFVVERRERSSLTDPNSIDAGIGGSGLIVYRVDTTVEGLSNYFGKTGVYIFRPQPGQTGYVAGNERQTLNNAYLSQESGRVSIGSEDSAARLEDGALTFSDGSNSGIKISEVSGSQGNEMTFTVSIPDASAYDLWENTGFPTNYAYTSLANIGNTQMAVGYENRASRLQLYQYENNQWTPEGSVLTDRDGISGVVLFQLNGSPAVAYLDGNGSLKIKAYSANGWSDLSAPVANVSNFDVQQTADGQSAHLCYIVDSRDAYYASVTAGSVSNPIRYASGLLGNPKVIVTDDKVYAAAYDALKSSIVNIYPLNGDATAFENPIQSPGNASAYDLIAYDNTLYFALGTSSQLQVKKYNGTSWEEYATLATDSFTPQLAVAQGNLYVLTVPSLDGSTDGLRAYSVAGGKLQPEGELVDRTGSNYSLIASKDNLFVGYTANGQAFIKKKTTANPLVSLSITPPDQTTYLKGQTVSTSGLKVVANYAVGSRELSPTEYQVTNFDTSTVGERLAVVSFEGKENTFAYTVLDQTSPLPTQIDRVTVSGVEAPQVGKAPDLTGTVSETGAEVESVVWRGVLDDGKFTYHEAYTVTVTLSAKTGYTFAGTVTATLNGETVQTVMNSDGTLSVTKTYPAQEAPEISANPDRLTLEIGESEVIVVTDPTGSALTWTSGDDRIATVDQNGKVTGIAAGSTEITVRNTYGKSVTIPVTVTAAPVPQPTQIDRVTVSGVEAPQVGKAPDLTGTVSETGAEVESVVWRGVLDDGKFTYHEAYTVTVTLSAKTGYTFAGTVTATLNGETVQAVMNSDGTLSVTKTYPAQEAPEISVNPDRLTLEIGESEVIVVTDPSGSALTWTSGDDGIATVDQNGKVTGIAAGSTEITVRNTYGKSVTIPVTVTAAPVPQPTQIDRVTVSGVEAPEVGKAPDLTGTVSETGAEVESVVWRGVLDDGKFTYHEAYTVTVTLSAKTGYTFAGTVTATLNGETVQAVMNSDGTLSVTKTYPAQEAPEISAEPDRLTLEIGESEVIVVTDPSGSALTWTSGDDRIATVDQNGKVTGIAAGSTEITVRNTYGKSVTIPVMVKETDDTQSSESGENSESSGDNQSSDTDSNTSQGQNNVSSGTDQDENSSQSNSQPGDQSNGQVADTGVTDGIIWLFAVMVLCGGALIVLVTLKKKQD